MFYAMISVCLTSIQPCNVEHALWAFQSDPVWQTSDECFAGARDFVQTQDISGFKGFVAGEDYRIEVTCEQTATKE
jgi:hypothetical protein